MTKLNPYLGFRGNAREALEFYQGVFGGELAIDTFGNNGMGDGPEADKVMHGQLETANGLLLMASDTPDSMELADRSNISISLSGDDDDELTGYWDGLSDGATVLEPLVVAPWGAKFGMLRDRFGVTWLVNIAAAAPSEG